MPLHKNTFPWTDELRDEALRLYREDVSAGDIAKQLGAKVGHSLSRSAILGLVHRKGAKRALATVKADTRTQRRVLRGELGPKKAGSAGIAFVCDIERPAHAAAQIPPVPTPPPTATARVLADLHAGCCRWPVGRATGADQLFCGERAVEERPYCVEHGRAARSSTTAKPLRPPPEFGVRRARATSPADARAA